MESLGALAPDLRKPAETRPWFVEEMFLCSFIARFLRVGQIPRDTDILPKNPLRRRKAFLSDELVRNGDALPRN